VLTLRYQEGQSFEEIAGQMGRSPNAARKLWARAVEALEEEMGPSAPGPEV
jgi:DNA-directed RNA polymerase specialized sigma24 family protein